VCIHIRTWVGTKETRLHEMWKCSSIFIIFLIPAICRGEITDDLMRKIEWNESRGGTGDDFVIDVASPKQVAALQVIAREAGKPAHRYKGNPIGAMGVMQVMPSTWLENSVPGEDPDNIQDCRNVARRYLEKLEKRHGLEKALWLYSGGARYVNTLK
jgi:hypothetical protein